MSATTLVGALAEQAADRPDDDAIVVDGADGLRFGAWAERSAALACWLQQRVVPGDPVALRFDAGSWAAFAVAYMGTLQAGTVAVLVPAGLADADAARIIKASGAVGVLCPASLAPAAPSPLWSAHPDDVQPGPRPPLPPVRLAAPAEITYPLSPMARPRPLSRSHADLADAALAAAELADAELVDTELVDTELADTELRPRAGWLVHTWAPGTRAGHEALLHALGGRDGGAASLASFSPAGLCRLIARTGATACGLTPGLAAALLAAGCAEQGQLDPVLRVVVSRSPGHPGLKAWPDPSRRGAGRRGPAQRGRQDSGRDADQLLPVGIDQDRPGGLGSGAAVPGWLDAGLKAAFPRATVHHGEEPQGEEPQAVVDGTDSQADPTPAGASQLGMLWHEQLSPGSFNLPCLVRRYRGKLDVDAFRLALAELARRHEPLRTTFELSGRGPRLVVGSDGAALAVVDLSELPVVDRDVRAAELIAAASERPFDLVEGPLFAPQLVRLAPEDHLLLVRLHHTAFDDWSVDVFRGEMSALYASFRAGEPPSRPESVRFSDVSRRQRARAEGHAGVEAHAWWRQQMAGAPFPVQLPLGRPDQLGPDRPGAGEPLRRDLDDDLAIQVRALARRLRATPFMTVLAAFAALLARRTGRDDLVLASVLAGRSTAEQEALIGCLTTKVLLRLRLDGAPTFPEIVARTRASVLGALSHQGLPFEAVVQETIGIPAAAHGVAAQVPVVFQGETPQQARLVLPGIQAEPFQAPAAARRERHFSTRRREGDDPSTPPPWGDGTYQGTFLLLSLMEAKQGLALVARGVFHRPAAEELLAELENLLEEMVAAPDGRPPAGGEAKRPTPPDEVNLRGLRLRPTRIEQALALCPGVAEVAVGVVEMDGAGPSLVAYVVPDYQPPTVAELRATLWSILPGSPWPAAVVHLDALPRTPDGRLDLSVLAAPTLKPATPAAPEAVLLSALWSSARGEPVGVGESYWQDFTFLQALADARAAGLPVTDEQVTRCRTPEMLAASLAARSG